MNQKKKKKSTEKLIYSDCCFFLSLEIQVYFNNLKSQKILYCQSNNSKRGCKQDLRQGLRFASLYALPFHSHPQHLESPDTGLPTHQLLHRHVQDFQGTPCACKCLQCPERAPRSWDLIFVLLQHGQPVPRSQLSALLLTHIPSCPFTPGTTSLEYYPKDSFSPHSLTHRHSARV